MIPGMHPAHDMEHAETARAERVSRLHHRFGREMSQRSRKVATWIVIFVAVACVIALALGWIAALSAG